MKENTCPADESADVNIVQAHAPPCPNCGEAMLRVLVPGAPPYVCFVCSVEVPLERRKGLLVPEVTNPQPGSITESVDHAVNMGIIAFNVGRYVEAAVWFRDAAAHVDTLRAREIKK